MLNWNYGLLPEHLQDYDDLSSDSNNMHHSYYDHIPIRGSPGRSGPLKAVHDLPVMFPDSDSGFGSGVRVGRSRHVSSEDFVSSPGLRRSASLSRLNGCLSEPSSRPTSPQHFGFDGGSLRGLNDSLQDSEHRRGLLVHKLKEAQDTLQLQNDRLNKIETAAKDNSFIVEDLKCKEREYRRKINNLQQYEGENERLQNDNLRLRQEMQDRIDSLDFQLKSLQNQHLHTTNENDKRTSLLDQTTTALSLLEDENCRLQMDRDGFQQEVELLKESLNLTKNKQIDEENRMLKTDVTRLTEENTILSKKIHAMAGQMVELRNLLQALKEENDRINCNFQNISQDKCRSSKQVENYQATITDLRSRLHSVTLDKDRLFQDKLDSNTKIQQFLLEREELLKHKQLLEEQVSEHQTRLSRSHISDSQKYDELHNMEGELNAVKKVCEELSTELASVKAYYERAMEQINMLENSRNLLQQQIDLTEQEKHRLQIEIERLSQILEGRNHGEKQELEMMEDNYLRLKNDYKELKLEKSQHEDRNHELEAKLRKANEDIKGATELQQGEMSTWKGTCDRLTSSLTRKEDELQKLTDKNHELEDKFRKLKEELRVTTERCEELTERDEDIERLRSENRRLLQETAENEQMMKLLETQKEVLTKTSESSFNKLHDVDHLSGKVDQLRHENDLLRDRILDLEKVRDNLIKQKEDLLANSDFIYKRPGLDYLEERVEELTNGHQKLTDTNTLINKQLDSLNKENTRLKQVIENGHGEPAMKEELERTRRQHCNLQDEFDQLLQDFNNLEEEKQKLERDLKHSKNNEINPEEFKKLKKERDAFQKQVQFVNGKLSLAEGSKKRANEEVTSIKKEMELVRQQAAVNKTINKSSTSNEINKLQSEIKQLKSQLNQSQETQHKQDLTITKLHEKSLQDVGDELSQMKEELHNLMEEIDSKDQTIVLLEKELKETKEDYEEKEKEAEEWKKKLLNSSDKKETTSPSRSSSIPRLVINGTDTAEHRNSPAPDSARSTGSIKEEVEEILKQKRDGQSPLKSRPAESLFTKKTLSKLRAAPIPWSNTKTPETTSPEQSKLETSGEGNEKMQSLITKYRSYNEPVGHSSLKNIRPFTFNPSPKSSTLTFASAKSPEEKIVKKLPIPPPVSPKPILKKPIKKHDTSPVENVTSYKPDASAVDNVINYKPDPQEQKDINTLIQNCQNSHLSFLLELSQNRSMKREINNLDTCENLKCEEDIPKDEMNNEDLVHL